MTDHERVAAPQVCLNFKIFIFKVCIFSLAVTHSNWRSLCGGLRLLLSCLDSLPNIFAFVYVIEIEIPYRNQIDNSYNRKGNRADTPFILQNLELLQRFFRKCYDAEINIESLNQEEAEAYEKIKTDLNLLVKNIFFKQVKFITSLGSELPELFPLTRQLEETKSELCCVNEKLFIQSSTTLPPYVAQRLARCIPTLPNAPIVWVEDPLSFFLMPFVASHQELDLVEKLLSGRIRPNELPEAVFKIFFLAKIVCKKQEATSDRQAFDFTQQAAESLQRDRYVVLRNILNPLQIAAYRSYYRSMRLSGLLRVEFGKPRLFKHNEILAKFVHIQLESLLNRILQEKVKKSYCFTRLHLGGASLIKHIDRPQCEWNVSLVFDMGPTKEQELPWPIFLEINGEPKEVLLQMGDAVLYQGTKLPHWRNKLPDGHETTITFFHFVNENFQGPLN